MLKETKKYKTAIGYLRTSSEGQGKYGTSLDSQKESIENFCRSNSIILINTYVDTFSGKDFKRPEYEKAHKFIKENRTEIDLFLTNKVDRFTRSAKHGLDELDEIKKLGVEVNFVNEWIEDVDSAQGRLVLSLKMSFAEYERLVIYERTRLGERRAMRSGRYIFGAPKGYMRGKLTNVSDDFIGKKGIVPNDEATFIKLIYEDYVKGIYTQSKLVEKYNRKGFKTSKSAISRILENPLYCGLIDLKKYKIEPFGLIKGIHEPLISEDLFYKAKEMKNGRNRMIKKTRPKNSEFPLSAKLACCNCNSPLYGSKGNNGSKKTTTREYGYYRCSKNCGEAYNSLVVNKELIKVLKKIKPSPNVLKLFQEILLEQYQSSIKEGQGIKISIDKKIRNKENERINLTKKYVSGKIPDDLFKITLDSLDSELSNLKIDKSKLVSEKEGLDKYLTFGFSLIMNLDKMFMDAPVDVQVQLLGSYFTDRLVFDGKKFRTLPFNETISLICRNNNDFKNLQKKTGEDFSINSRLVLSSRQVSNKYLAEDIQIILDLF
ncbi:MAG: recombinase family protein [Polaribacter sp.]